MRIRLISALLLSLSAAAACAADPIPSTTAPAYTLSPARVAQLKATTIIYQSLHVRPSDTDVERKTIEDLMAKLVAAHIRPTGGPIFIFPRAPRGGGAPIDLDIAIPVPDNTPAPEGCQVRTLESAPAVTAIYQGSTTGESMGKAASRLYNQLPALHQIPTGELRTRSLYHESDASPNNIALIEIPTTPDQ